MYVCQRERERETDRKTDRQKKRRIDTYKEKVINLDFHKDSFIGQGAQ